MWLRRREKQDGVGESEGADSSSCYYYELSVRKSNAWVCKSVVCAARSDRKDEARSLRSGPKFRGPSDVSLNVELH
jgi:hypothetical protein